MPGIKNYKIDNPGGRPSKYRPEYAQITRTLILNSADCSDAQLARIFGVGKATIVRWKYEYEDFRNAYNEAWDHINVHGVEQTLVKRALGYEYEEVTKELLPLSGELVITRIVKKRMAPDVKAIEIYLRNRAPKRWPKGESKEGIGALNIEIHTEPKPLG
jgi:hypothetical protein